MNNIDEKQKTEEQAIVTQDFSSPVLTPTTQSSQASVEEPKAISAEDVKKESLQLKDENTLRQEKKELKKSLKKKRKKQRLDYTNFLLILAIFLLLVVIISPPILRIVMPKQKVITNKENKKIIILSCTGLNQSEQYKITSRTKYENNDPKQNIITYTKLTADELSIEINKTPVINTSSSQELSFFQTIRGLNISESKNNKVVTITDYLAERNTGNFEFMNYFQKLELQKTFYINQGYSCEEIKD